MVTTAGVGGKAAATPATVVADQVVSRVAEAGIPDLAAVQTDPGKAPLRTGQLKPGNSNSLRHPNQPRALLLNNKPRGVCSFPGKPRI